MLLNDIDASRPCQKKKISSIKKKPKNQFKSCAMSGINFLLDVQSHIVDS